MYIPKPSVKRAYRQILHNISIVMLGPPIRVKKNWHYLINVKIQNIYIVMFFSLNQTRLKLLALYIKEEIYIRKCTFSNKAPEGNTHKFCITFLLL